jgi:hypothetical protein
MAFKIDETEVISDAKQLSNIARLDEPAITNIIEKLAPVARYATTIQFENAPVGVDDTLTFAFDVNGFDVDVDSTLTVGDTIVLGGFTTNFTINGFDCNNLNNRIVAISAIDTTNNTISIVTLMDGQDDDGTGNVTFPAGFFGTPYIRGGITSPTDFITIREVLTILG